MGMVDGFGKNLKSVHLVEATSKGQRPIGEETLEHLNRFLQPAHALTCGIERNACHLGLSGDPSGAQPKLEASF